MEVIHIGEYTYGKYTGMWVIGDTQRPARRADPAHGAGDRRHGRHG